MTSRRSNSCDSDRVQTRTGVANVEWTKDPEGETSVARVKSSSQTGSDGRDRPPKKAKMNGLDRRIVVPNDTAVAKPFHWQFSHSKDFPITEDPDSVAHLVRYFKPVGCPLLGSKSVTTESMSESNGHVSKSAADKLEYGNRTADKPSSIDTRRPSMHTAPSLYSDRAVGVPGRYVATEHAYCSFAT
uniref:Uncharacterized protein n=1 Tax=Brassica campestris TaxID=3711 RepID=M4F077_BRACM